MKLNKILAQPKKASADVIPTGINSLDKMIGGGLHIGEICTVAARPGMGKTSFVMSVVRNVGVLNKIPTAIMSFEANEEYFVNRLLAAEIGWATYDFIQDKNEKEDSDDVKTAISIMEDIGFESPEKRRKEYLQQMKEAPVWIEFCTDVIVDEIIGRIERLKKTDDIQVLVIDGIEWLMTGQDNTERELMMLKLAQTAIRLRVAVLLTVDVSRNCEFRACNKRPAMVDVKSCVAIYSSVVLFIYRPEYYLIDKFEDDVPAKNMADLIVAKNHYGEVTFVRVSFFQQARFEDWDNRIEEADDPMPPFESPTEMYFDNIPF